MESAPAAKNGVKRQDVLGALLNTVVIFRVEVREAVARKTTRQAPAGKPRKSSRSKQGSLPTFTYTPHQRKLLAEIENDEVGDFVEDPPREDA